MPSFVTDVEEIRARAARKIEEGAVTSSYKGDVEQTVSILNEALATEIVCVLRYMHHYFMATGIHGTAVRNEFKEHADAEREHADKIGERIQQLGGKPDYNPGSLVQRSVSQYAEGETLADMIREDLIAERIVIEVYQKMIRYFADNDPTTRVMIEGILRDEEEHASDLSDLLFIVDPKSGETEGEDPGTHPLDMHHNEQSRQQRASKGGSARAGSTAGAVSAGPLSTQSTEVGRGRERGDGEKGPQQSSVGGNRNREGIGNLVSGDKTLMESPERVAPAAEERTQKMASRSDSGPQRGGRGITNRGDQGQGQVVKGRQQQQTSGRGTAEQTEHQPGGRGRPMNRRRADEGDLDTGNAGAMSGGTRSVKVTNKNRKNRAA